MGWGGVLEAAAREVGDCWKQDLSTGHKTKLFYAYAGTKTLRIRP